jgi:hypothetical protein
LFFLAVVFTYLGQLLSVGNVRFAHIPSTQQLSLDVNTTASKKPKQILFTLTS